MTQDFAKIKPEPLLERKPIETPPAWSLMVTGIVVGIAIGVFACFLFYMSGNVPALNVSTQVQNTSAESAIVATAIEAAEVEAPLEFEFYNELQEYEVEVDATPVTIAVEEPISPVSSEETATSPSAVEVQQSIPAPATNPPATTISAAEPAATVIDRPLDERIMLQTGAFRQQDLANTEMQRLQALGLSVMVKRQDLVGGTLFLVQTGPYDTSLQLSTAERLLERNNIASMPLSLR